MIKKVIVVALAMTLGLHDASAKSNREIREIYEQCGLGGAIFSKSSPLLAIISNVTFDLGTTAALSDAFSPDTCSGGKMRTAVLIKEGLPSLETDLASGEGAYLDALAKVAHCQSTGAIRSQYAQYVQSTRYDAATADQNAEKLYEIVDNNCDINL